MKQSFDCFFAVDKQLIFPGFVSRGKLFGCQKIPALLAVKRNKFRQCCRCRLSPVPSPEAIGSRGVENFFSVTRDPGDRSVDCPRNRRKIPEAFRFGEKSHPRRCFPARFSAIHRQNPPLDRPVRRSGKFRCPQSRRSANRSADRRDD